MPAYYYYAAIHRNQYFDAALDTGAPARNGAASEQSPGMAPSSAPGRDVRNGETEITAYLVFCNDRPLPAPGHRVSRRDAEHVC